MAERALTVGSRTPDLCRDDEAFDRLLPAWARALSTEHFTPVAVARRAVALLDLEAGDVVLDVGAGIGKFCLVGALCSPARFVGVEQRPTLVDAAQAIAAKLACRASFVSGDALALDWSAYNGVYLFNPYSEAIFDHRHVLPGAVPRSAARHTREVEETCRKLHTLKPGARVATYHGYGGPMPARFRRVIAESIGSHRLEVWEKQGL